jgi:hypothetical protein
MKESPWVFLSTLEVVKSMAFTRNTSRSKRMGARRDEIDDTGKGFRVLEDKNEVGRR